MHVIDPKLQNTIASNNSMKKNVTDVLHHIFDESGKKLTIDSLINGNNQKV